MHDVFLFNFQESKTNTNIQIITDSNLSQTIDCIPEGHGDRSKKSIRQNLAEVVKLFS